jgi:hypothetical protein
MGLGLVSGRKTGILQQFQQMFFGVKFLSWVFVIYLI